MTENHAFMLLLLLIDVIVGTIVALKRYSSLRTFVYLVATTVVGYFGLMPLATYFVSGQFDISFIRHLSEQFVKNPSDIIQTSLLAVAVNYAVFRACRWMVWVYGNVTA